MYYKISQNHLRRQDKAFDKNQDPLLQKTFSANKKYRRFFSRFTKGISKNPTANNKFEGDRLTTFFLR